MNGSTPSFATAKGMGWLPDRPDLRDYTTDTDTYRGLLSGSSSQALQQVAERSASGASGALPKSVDLRQWCSPVEDQGSLGSCTANAACGVVEYFERRTHGRFIDASRLFVYKVTRQLLGITGDTGAYLRSTMGALALFGAPPEEIWPYDISRFDDDPPAFAFAYAQNYQALTYARLDPLGATGDEVLAAVKSHLAGGIPSMFGFTVYGSIRKPVNPGDIPFPGKGENVLGGHAIMAVGYDDARVVHSPTDGPDCQGAFLIRNSWGESWGDHGYGWLPYEYAKRRVAQDWWVVTKAEWVETSAFDEQ